jgi:hypothetical protein
MPRTPKDPNNPITKLRRQLSTPHQAVTRQMFGKHYGFSAETLKALETGRYKLSERVALKIAVAVGVDADSLLKNQDPLLDWHGNPVTPNTKPRLRKLNLNANHRLDYLINAAFNAARKHPNGDQSPLFVLLFDYWLADTMVEMGVLKEFWEHLWRTKEYDPLASGDMFPVVGKSFHSKASLEKKMKTERYIERPQQVCVSDYGFHELVARGLARPAMLKAEGKRLLLEYLTPAEIAKFDEPIDVHLQSTPDAKFKLNEPEQIAYRRFAESKGINPTNKNAISKAFAEEAWRRFEEKEERWRRGEDDSNPGSTRS